MTAEARPGAVEQVTNPSFWRGVPILVLCEALVRGSTTILLTESALVGLSLATDRAFATAGIATQYLTTLLFTYPASLLMGRFGRKVGFSVGAVLGMGGATVASIGILRGQFVVFCAGTALIGAYNGFASFYRFAATEFASSDREKSSAVAWVLTGGLFAALTAPLLAGLTVDAFPQAHFLGSYVALGGLSAGALLVLQFLRTASDVKVAKRSAVSAQFIRSKLFVANTFVGATGYGVMTFIMTGTPLAMHSCHHDFSATSQVIQWHVIAMFAPSLVTGKLVAKFGAVPVMAVGIGLFLACSLTAWSGTSVGWFWSALVLLGLGWNLVYVGSTSLLARAPAEERAKAQGLNDVVVFGTVSLAAFSSGVVFDWKGWDGINLVALPLLIASGVLLMTVSSERSQRIAVKGT